MAEPKALHDALLAELAESLAAYDERSDANELPWPALERLARGQLSAAELSELEERARTNPALLAAIEGHRPLPAHARQQLSDAVASALAGPPNLAPQKEPRRLWPLLGLPALAAAASLALWLSSSSLPPLLPYQLEVVEHASPQRGDPGSGKTSTLRIGSPELVLVLRPTTEHGEAVDARVFVVAEGVGPRLLPSAIEHASTGALRLNVPTASLPAQGLLWVLLGRKGTLPKALEPNHVARDWQRFELPFARD